MIEKKALIELVRHRVNGELQAKQLGKVGDQLLAYYIGRTYNSSLTAMFTRGGTNFDPYTKEYQSVAISQDTNTDVYYSTLPEKIINLPRKAGNGVIRISGMKSTSIEFAPIHNNALQSITTLEINDVDDVVGYVYKNGRVEYQGMTATIASGTVKMELVIPFEAYDDTDEVMIPTGSDEILVQNVVQLIINTPDADRFNNGNSVNKNMK